MRLTSKRLLCAGALLLSMTCTAHASDPAPSYPEILVDDVKHVLSAPARWQEQEWRDMGLAAFGIAGVVAIIDRPVRDEMRRHAPNNSRFLLEVERFGKEYSLAVLGGFYLAGALGNDDKAAAVAEDGLSALIIASGIITPAIKFATGRSRPRDNAGIAKLHPFSIGYYSANSSFPSGHATHAFALASVIANHYEETWVTCSSYTIASLVGVARSYHDAHFASDVLTGALIGTLVGKSVVAHNKPMRTGQVALLPEITPGLVGVRIVGKF
ncbi:MAG: phosphatase PAP2 family protein [Gallionella sp.]|nr:phosphatase PAP2 family protein [Gallionella sp.]